MMMMMIIIIITITQFYLLPLLICWHKIVSLITATAQEYNIFTNSKQPMKTQKKIITITP